MHLPPLDVAVYPIVTMSQGRHIGRPTRPSSIISSSSSSSTASASARIFAPDFLTIQNAIQTIFRSSKITLSQIERVQGRIHPVYLIRLADETSLVLKCKPDPHNTRILQHEKHGLETERKTLETLREYTQLPVSQVIKYESSRGPIGLPFLLTSRIPGRRYSELSAFATTAQRQDIERTLGSYVRTLTSLSATQFGPTHLVFGKKGYSTWREAFMSLLKTVIQDSEEKYVTIPYESIRYYIGEHEHVLDEVTEPRLVALNVCEPQNVLIDEQTMRVTGLVGFSNVVWGDPMMSGGVEKGSDSFFEGYGECPARTGSVKARMLIYATYRSIVQVVAHHYRPQSGIDEMDARRVLAQSLNELAQM